MYAQASDNSHVLSNASETYVKEVEKSICTHVLMYHQFSCTHQRMGMFTPVKLRDLTQHAEQQHATSCVLGACQPATHQATSNFLQQQSCLRTTPRFLDALRQLSRVGPKEKTRCMLPFSIDCNMYNRNVFLNTHTHSSDSFTMKQWLN